MAKNKSNLTELQALVAQAAAQEDHTDVSSGGGDFPVAAEGLHKARFIEYVELGEQKQKPWQGKAKKDAETVRIGFELLSKNAIREIDVDGKKVTVTDKIYLTIPKLMSERAKFYKLFEKMRYDREGITHMAQMLGEGFIVKVVHNHKKDDDGKVLRTYANITNKDGSFLVSGPFKEDADTETKVPYSIPEAISPIRGFLFNFPTQKTWDSLFIDGDRTFKDEKGKEKTVTKNWIQEKILAAANYEGSALEAMLDGGDDLPTPNELEDEDELEDTEEEDIEEMEEEEEELEEAPAPKKPVAKAKAPVKKPVAAQPAPKKAKSATAKVTPTAKPAAKTASRSKKNEGDALLEDLGLLGDIE